jgi:hypothetical protein
MILEKFYLNNFLNKNNIFQFIALLFYLKGSLNKKENLFYLSFSSQKDLLPFLFFFQEIYKTGFIYSKSNNITFQIFSKKQIKNIFQNLKTYFNFTYTINENNNFFLQFKQNKIKLNSIVEKFVLYNFFNYIVLNYFLKNNNSSNLYISIKYHAKNKYILYRLKFYLLKYFNIESNICINSVSSLLYIKKTKNIYAVFFIIYNFFIKFFKLKKIVIKYLLYIYLIRKYNLDLNPGYSNLVKKFYWYYLFLNKNK